MPPQQRVNDTGYPPPTQTNNSIALKEYFDSLIQEKEKRYEQRFMAQQSAVDKVDMATEKRFESVNEFRNALKDQQATFISRVESETKSDYINKSIEKNQADIGAIRLLAAQFLTVEDYNKRHDELQAQITSLRETRSLSEGGQSNRAQTWSYAVAGVGILIAVVSFILK